MGVTYGIKTDTAMAGAKTNNNQLKAACRRGHAAAKLLLPSCRQAAHHCRTAAATTDCRCRNNDSVAARLLPLRPRCHQAAAATAKMPALAELLPLPPRRRHSVIPEY
jgi:hypothetical protein